MLPAPKSDGLSLADVLRSSLQAIRREPDRLALPPVENAIVVLLDGLGADALKARAGHARTLAGALTPRAIIESGFPTTTASALASLTTGTSPGQHGLVGYTVLDAAHDRMVNQLTGWDDRLDPLTWQLAPTLFEAASTSGIDAIAIGPERYRDSGFTRAVLRGARFVAATSIAGRMQRAAAEVRSPGQHLVYVYVPELDSSAHGHGIESPQWVRALETVDAAIADLIRFLGPRDGLLVTADHGIVDIPHHAHVLVDGPLLDGVRFVAGEPRCLQLHFEADADPVAIAGRWRDAEGSRAWVATRDEAIAAGWFGVVRPEVAPRIGDLLVAARKHIAYYDGRSDSPHGRSMIGQHGSWSPAEVRVPLLRFGAFAP
jgi:predicted AlkP superfamily pyrophosphatase or phosphodiesterase